MDKKITVMILLLILSTHIFCFTLGAWAHKKHGGSTVTHVKYDHKTITEVNTAYEIKELEPLNEDEDKLYLVKE